MQEVPARNNDHDFGNEVNFRTDWLFRNLVQRGNVVLCFHRVPPMKISPPSAGCGCKAGSIDVSDLNSPLRTAADCQACTAGLDCPTMSTVAALKAGVSPVGEEFTPMVIEGYLDTEV